MTQHHVPEYDLTKIDLEARRLRAEAMRDGLKRLGQWLRKPRHMNLHIGGKHA